MIGRVRILLKMGRILRNLYGLGAMTFKWSFKKTTKFKLSFEIEHLLNNFSNCSFQRKKKGE
jgi:hypothetical protein